MFSNIFVDRPTFKVLSETLTSLRPWLGSTILVKDMASLTEFQRLMVNTVMGQMDYREIPTMGDVHKFCRMTKNDWRVETKSTEIELYDGRTRFRIIQISSGPWVRDETMPALDFPELKVRDAKHAREITQQAIDLRQDLVEMMECVYDAGEAGNTRICVDWKDDVLQRQQRLIDKLQVLGFETQIFEDRFQISW